jgi:hypothetical protein
VDVESVNLNLPVLDLLPFDFRNALVVTYIFISILL